jgi:uncharacterized alpha-E superfamily protein
MKNIEEILREFIPHSASYCIKDLSQSIKSLLRERMSKKRIMPYNASEGIKNCDAGFNLAIDEFNQMIEEL